MYLHLGQEIVVLKSDIIGVFDIENTTVSGITRGFLSTAEKQQQVTYVAYDLPKSFTVCVQKDRKKPPQVIVSPIAPRTLKKRAAN